MKRQRRSTNRPSFPLSGKRTILSFARTGTPPFIPEMHRFGAVCVIIAILNAHCVQVENK